MLAMTVAINLRRQSTEDSRADDQFHPEFIHKNARAAEPARKLGRRRPDIRLWSLELMARKGLGACHWTRQHSLQ